jgi:polyhydroxyalkanoate synthesis repressor PhaR
LRVSEPRIIKKYPNRRLYDTAISSYITLEDVRRLVLENVTFQVLDAKTDEDISRNILLQIILEQEEGGEPIFSTDVLQQIIRFYGDTLQAVIASYLDKSLKLFVSHQHSLREQMQNVGVSQPLALMREIADQNISLWKEMQEGLFRAKSAAARAGGSKRKKVEEKVTAEGGS